MCHQKLNCEFLDAVFVFVNTFKLLGVTPDREINFDNHVSNVCKKVNQKFAIINNLQQTEKSNF